MSEMYKVFQCENSYFQDNVLLDQNEGHCQTANAQNTELPHLQDLGHST